MASHGNFSMPLNCEAFLSDPDVVIMEPAELGIYILLLMNAWLSDDGGLPNDSKKLRKLARCDKDEWGEYSPAVLKKFFKKGSRVYNKRLLEELEKLNARRSNGARGGKAKAKQSSSESLAKVKQSSSETPSKNLHPEPEPEPELELRTRDINSRGETKRIGDIDWNNAGGYDYESVIRKYLTPENWDRSGHTFLWACENLNLAECIEIVKGFHDRMDEASRKAKGYTQPQNAGGYLRSEFQKLSERMGKGKLPTDSQAKQMRLKNSQ